MSLLKSSNIGNFNDLYLEHIYFYYYFVTMQEHKNPLKRIAASPVIRPSDAKISSEFGTPNRSKITFKNSHQISITKSPKEIASNFK